MPSEFGTNTVEIEIKHEAGQTPSTKTPDKLTRGPMNLLALSELLKCHIVRGFQNLLQEDNVFGSGVDAILFLKRFHLG